MDPVVVAPSDRAGAGLRLFVTVMAVLLLPPLVAVLAAPLALLLMPLAWLAIPFIVISMLNNSLAAGARRPKRAAQRPLQAPRHAHAAVAAL